MFSWFGKNWLVWESINRKGQKKSNTKNIANVKHSKLFYLYISLTICGLLMIASSSSYTAANNLHNIFYYLQKQSVFVIISLFVGFVITRIPVIFWQKVGPGLLLLGSMLLALVFVLNNGPINGSYRWLTIGSINFQPSEFVKIAIIVYLAGYLVRNQEVVKNSLSAFIRPIILISLVSSLVLLEPDLGGALVFLTITITMMFIGGVNIIQFILFSFSAVLVSGLAAFLSTYRLARITALSENIMQSVNTYDNNYQILQSLIAFGQGQLTGLGFAASRQKLLYLPEAHTDFIFAIIAEELGLIGIVLLMALLVALIRHILVIAKRASDCRHLFAAIYAYGFATLIALHTFIHIAVTIRLLPTTGITLPFISYGGSSFLALTIGLAIVLRIEHELCPLAKAITRVK